MWANNGSSHNGIYCAKSVAWMFRYLCVFSSNYCYTALNNGVVKRTFNCTIPESDLLLCSLISFDLSQHQRPSNNFISNAALCTALQTNVVIQCMHTRNIIGWYYVLHSELHVFSQRNYFLALSSVSFFGFCDFKDVERVKLVFGSDFARTIDCCISVSVTTV